MLHQVLLHTFSSNSQLRKEAEIALGNAAGTPGYALELLKIAVTITSNDAVDQAAAIALKNLIKRHWRKGYSIDASNNEAMLSIPESDKQVLRQNLMESLFLTHSKPPVRRLLVECIRQLAGHDYPREWPELLSQIHQYLLSEQIPQVDTGLQALRKLCKVFERVSAEKDDETGLIPREPLEHIVKTMYPTLLNLLKDRIGKNPSQVCDILKIFLTCSVSTLPSYIRDQPQIALAWYEQFEIILNLGTDVSAWTKAQTRVLSIITPIFRRFGSTLSIERTTEHASHAKMFIESGMCVRFLIKSLAFLAKHAEILAQSSSSEKLPNELILYCLAYIGTSIEEKSTYAVIRSNLDFLIQGVIFPILKFSKEDEELLTDDQEEYIRRNFDIEEETFDPRAAALQVLVDLCRLKPKTCLDPVVMFCWSILKRYSDDAQKSISMASEKEAALRMLAAISHTLKGRKKVVYSQSLDKLVTSKKWEIKPSKYADQLESLIAQHVLPELTQSPYPFLRARTCATLAAFLDIKWTSGPDGPRAVITALVRALRDPYLLVQTRAAAALGPVFHEGNEEMLQVVKPHLREIVQELFRIMQILPIQEVMAGLNELIVRFAEEMVPLAGEIANHLALVFCGYIQASNVKHGLEGEDGVAQFVENGNLWEDENDESSLAAVNCLEAITSLLSAVSEHPEIMNQLDMPLIPLLQIIIDPDVYLIDYLEPGLKILSFFVYYSSKPLCPEIWNLFAQMYRCFENWAFDYIREFSIIIEHFIQKEPEVFKTCRDPETGMYFVEMVYNMTKKVLTYDGASWSEKKAAIIVLCTSLQSLPGAFDGNPLQDIIQTVLTLFSSLTNKEDLSSKVDIMLLIESCLLYNPLMTLEFVGQGNIPALFSALFALLPEHQLIKDKKLAALAMCAIIRVPLSKLPPVVQQGMPILMNHLAELLVNIERERALLEKENNENGEETAAGEELLLGDEEDAFDAEYNEEDEANEMRETLQTLKDLRQQGEEFWDDEGDGDWDDDDDAYSSSIDVYDEFIVLHESIGVAMAAEPTAFKNMMAQLNPHAQKAIQDAILKGIERKKEEEEHQNKQSS